MEILGLLDTLEALILKGGKVPFSNKKVVEEERLLIIIDKIRKKINEKYDGDLKIAENKSLDNVYDEDSDQAATSLAEEIEVDNKQESVKNKQVSIDKEAEEYIAQAKEEIEARLHEVDTYADDVLANLELTINKMKRNILRLEDNIVSGRKQLKENLEKPEIDED